MGDAVSSGDGVELSDDAGLVVGDGVGVAVGSWVGVGVAGAGVGVGSGVATTVGLGVAGFGVAGFGVAGLGVAGLGVGGGVALAVMVKYAQMVGRVVSFGYSTYASTQTLCLPGEANGMRTGACQWAFVAVHPVPPRSEKPPPGL